MSTDAEHLANPAELVRLEPTCPTSLDGQLQQEVELRPIVASADFVERIFKLFGLFTSHLVIREAHLLDHLATRAFFLDLRQDARREIVEYLTNPGRDPLGLGPVILSSEPYDPQNRHHPFPLRDLLKRKLGLDERQYDPWELSSIYRLEDLRTANEEIHSAHPDKRLELATSWLAPDGTYGTFLDLVSVVWDKNASVTRIPWENADFLTVLRRSLGDAAGGSGETASAASAILERLRDGKLLMPDGTVKKIIRSTINPELRQLPGGYDLQWLVKEADWEAFLLSFPSRRGWATASDPQMLGYWRSPESGSIARPKRSIQEAVSIVAEGTGGSIALDRIQFSEITKLRQTQAFHDSLARIQAEWRWCHSLDALAAALKDHVLLIYGQLGLNKRSSTRLHPGADVRIEVGSELVPSFFDSDVGAHSVSFLSPKHWVGPVMAAAIRYVVSWLREKSALRRDLKDVAKRITEASVDSPNENRSTEKRQLGSVAHEG